MKINQFGLENECIKVYNPEKKELIGVYENYKKAERATGLSAKVIKAAGSSKTRRYSPFLKMEIAIRVSSLKQTT